MTEYGIDVSSFNTINSWASVRSANSWAWAKATQGSGYTSSLFAGQMAGGRAAGLSMGAYHFPDPRVSVATNVAHFVSIAKAAGAFAKGAFLPMLDMENSPTDGITWSAGGANSFIPAFRDALRAATGVQLLCVYGSESWYATGFLQPNQWADGNVVLCAAQYSGQPGVLGWSHPRLAVHQYTDAAPTPGAAGNTDRSVILAPFTLSQLTVGGSVSPSTSSQEDAMGNWFKFTAADGSVGSGLLLENGDFVGLPLPTGAPFPLCNLNDGTDAAGAQGRWDDLRTRKARSDATLAQAIADALKADGVGTGAGGTTNITAAIPTAWKTTDLGGGVTEIKAETA